MSLTFTTLQTDALETSEERPHGMWTYLTGATISSPVASFDVDFETYGGDYDILRIICRKMTVETDNTAIDVTLSFDSGSTFEAGTTYNYFGLNIDDNDTSLIKISSTGASDMVVTSSVGNAADESFQLDMIFDNWSSTVHSKYGTSQSVGLNDAAVMRMLHMGWTQDATDALDVVRITGDGGNIDGGEWALYGLKLA